MRIKDETMFLVIEICFCFFFHINLLIIISTKEKLEICVKSETKLYDSEHLLCFFVQFFSISSESYLF